MRNKVLALAAAALAVTAPTLTTPAFAAAKQSVAEKGQERLAKMLDGRVAGKPVQCISAMNPSNVQVIDETALVYKSGSTVYVARPLDPKSLGSNDILVTKRNGSLLCANDSMHTIDRGSGFFSGVVMLNDFVPYTKQG